MDGVYRFDMCGSNSCCFQQMRIWTGGTCCSGASVTVDNGCVDGYPQYDLAMTSGQVVYIEVGKSGGEWAIAPLYQFNVTVAVDSCPAPDSLVIYTVGDNVVLTWSAADCDTPLYTIYRSATSDVQIIPANEIATTTTTTYTDPGILGGPGDKSFYAVTATN
jgi:hypothetical protein